MRSAVLTDVHAPRLLSCAKVVGPQSSVGSGQEQPAENNDGKQLVWGVFR